MNAASSPVVVIGAGWSGLACALRLAGRVRPLLLVDAAPTIGGRARRVRVRLGAREHDLDNGQHLLVGAYQRTLALMRATGVDVERALLRLPFQLHYPDGWALVAPRLPAPWHLAAALLRARGLTWTERRALATTTTRWRRAGWQVTPDRPAAALFDDAPARLVQRLWEPLCLAALNVRLAAASAQVLLNVLRDTLGAAAEAADLLVPRRDLGAVLPDAALQRLQVEGVAVRTGCVVRELRRHDAGWLLHTGDGATLPARAVVLALPPPRAGALLQGLAAHQSTAAELAALPMAPIATVYLQYDAGIALARPLHPLLDAPDAGAFGQWAFDRGQLDARHAGIVSVVISGAGAHLEYDHAALGAAVAMQLQRQCGLPPARATAVIAEKRATIVPAPGLQRPPARLVRGLYLAGDAADSPYPSTLEGSIRAGEAAADALVQDRLSA